MPYADYELAKMYRDGVGTTQDAKEAELHFEIAFHGFQQMERQSRDDKLQYRLGQMLYTGTEKEVDKAIHYLEKSARLGNVNAQYMLGKIYLDASSGHLQSEKAIHWLTKASDNGNGLAQYALGKLYLLGKDVPKEIETAIRWLTTSAEQGNQYAQYTIGKLYLLGRDVPRDREAAVHWLTLSAEQGNIYAQFFLDNLDSFRDPSMFLATTRLLHHISQIFQEEVKRLYSNSGIQTESKLCRKLRQKKIAQGHAPDDHEQKLTTY
jgi:TPR repeat protein